MIGQREANKQADGRNIAMVAKRDIKRVNNPGDILAMPAALAGGPPRYNIFAGNF